AGMAALKLGWDAGLSADLGKLVGRFGGDREAVVPEIIGIALAAAAFRRFIKRYSDRRRLDRPRLDRPRCRPGGGGNPHGSSGGHRLLRSVHLTYDRSGDKWQRDDRAGRHALWRTRQPTR